MFFSGFWGWKGEQTAAGGVPPYGLCKELLCFQHPGALVLHYVFYFESLMAKN